MADRYRLTTSGQNWSNTAYWSSTLGGGGGASVPVWGDTATFRAVSAASIITLGANTSAPTSITVPDSIVGTDWTFNSGGLVLNGVVTINTTGSSPTAVTQRTLHINTTVVSGTGSIEKYGLGMLVMGASSFVNNTYTGGTTVYGGWISPVYNLSSDGYFGTGTLTFNNTSGNPSFGIVSAASSNTYTIKNLIVPKTSFQVGLPGITTLTMIFSGIVDFSQQLSPITITFNTNITQSGQLTGNAGNVFTKSGPSTLTLSAANPFAGTVNVTQGTLTVSNAQGLKNAVWAGGAGTTTFVASSFIGALGGSTNLAPTTALTLGGVDVSANGSWTGGFTTNTPITKQGTGTQELGGNSTGRTTASTSITGGAIQLNSATGLYASGSTNTTTVSSGAALFLNGNFTVSSGNALTVTGDGISLTGALRNLAGTNTYGGTVTLSGPTRIHADSGSLTVSSLNLNNQTATLSGGGTITVSAASGYGKLIVTGTAILSALSISSLDGTGTVSGNATIASGGQWASGNGAGNGTLTITGSLTTSGDTTLVSGGVSGGVASKVAVTGAINTGGVVTVKGSGTGWQSGVSKVVLSYGTTAPNVSGTAGAWNDSVNSRIGNGTVTWDSVAKSFSLIPATATGLNISWNGGASGVWQTGGSTGWTLTSTGATLGFENTDNVSFSIASSVTLNSNVTVGNITFVKSSTTISGTGSITASSDLRVGESGFITNVTLSIAGTYGNLYFPLTSPSTLIVNHPLAIQGSGEVWATIVQGASKIRFALGANGLSSNRVIRNPDLNQRYFSLDSTDGSIVTLSAAPITAGGGLILYKTGNGLVYFSNTSFSTRVEVNDSTVTNGTNVIRVFQHPNIQTNNGGICECVSTSVSPSFRPAVNGGGFSSYNVSGLTVNFSSTVMGSSWVGPMYFGTGLNTALGKTTIGGTVNLNGQSQTFSVFLGESLTATNNDSTGELSGIVSGTGSLIKAGLGTLVLSATNTYTAITNFNSGILSVSTIGNGGVAGNLGQATNAAANIVFNGGTLRYTGAASSTDRNFTLTGNGTIEASGSGRLTWSGVPTIASGAKTLTLGGTGFGTMSGILANSSGTLAITKSGTSAWTLSNSNTYTGGTTISAGKLVASKKTALGTGPVTLSGTLQITDTTTDPAKVASTGSFTASGGSARIIIGA
jgi:fibronectin-binding autotransporter adhesin